MKNEKKGLIVVIITGILCLVVTLLSIKEQHLLTGILIIGTYLLGIIVFLRALIISIKKGESLKFENYKSVWVGFLFILTIFLINKTYTDKFKKESLFVGVYRSYDFYNKIDFKKDKTYVLTRVTKLYSASEFGRYKILGDKIVLKKDSLDDFIDQKEIYAVIKDTNIDLESFPNCCEPDKTYFQIIRENDSIQILGKITAD